MERSHPPSVPKSIQMESRAGFPFGSGIYFGGETWIDANAMADEYGQNTSTGTVLLLMVTVIPWNGLKMYF